MKRKSQLLFIALLATLLSFVLLTSVAAKRKEPKPPAKKYTLYYVDHGIAGNPFWVVYFKGIEDATAWLAPYGVTVKHMSAEADVKKQIDMLQQAVAANPDGLATTMIDPKSFEPILKPLVDKGIPIMAANVEDPRPSGERIPYLAYYGEDTWRSGVEVADALIRYIKETNGFKPKFALLCNPMAGHYVWEARLKMFGETLNKTYGTKSEKIVVGEDPTKAIETVKAYLVKNPGIDVMNGPVWLIHSAVKLVQEVGKEAGKNVYLCTFDLMPELLQDIKDGKVVATHDQQQYLQGFLPLIDLYLYLTKYKVHPYGVVGTGPIIVDRHNVNDVVEGSKAGYR